MYIQQHKKLTIACCVVLATLAILYGTAYVIAKTYLNPAKIREMIASQASQKLNRTVTIGDDIGLSIDWNMSPHVKLHKIFVANTTWASQQAFFSADELDIHFSLIKLLFNELHIISLRLVNAKLNLETMNDKDNWTFTKSTSADASSSNIKLSVHKITVRNGEIGYNSDRLALDKLDFSANSDKTDFHVHLQGKHNSLPIKTTVEVERTSNQIKLDIVNFQTGSSNFSGNLLIEKDPLNITGDFSADSLNIKDFNTANSSTSGTYTVSNAKLPIDMLKGSKFEISVKIKQLDLGGVILSNVNLVTKNDKDVLHLDLVPAATVDAGKFYLNASYDLNQTAPLLKLQAKTTQLQLATLLQQAFGKTPITGSSFEFNSNLSGRGDNLQSIVNSLNGQILAQVGPGQFLNANASLGFLITNVLTSVISYDKNVAATDITCAVMNFKVSNGVANANRGIGLEARSGNVLGNGMIDLRNGRINFSLEPQNLTANPVDIAHFSVAQFVSIQGTISKPVVTLNTANLIKQSTNTLIAAGVAGGLTGGVGALFTTGAASMLENKLGVTQQPVASPCKTALGQ
jgi:uncharacterized protein involved in outer membrane biogenesis